MSRWFKTYGFAEVGDELFVGAYPLDEGDVAMLQRLGVEKVLNLVEDSEYEDGQRESVQAALAAAGIQEERLALTDFGNLPEQELGAAVRLVSRWLKEGHRTYVHCRAGWQRSAAVAAGVLAQREGLDIDAAVRRVRERKPTAAPLPHQREDLRRWWESRGRPRRA
jgi:protein-tyrosine phosphatase